MVTFATELEFVLVTFLFLYKVPWPSQLPEKEYYFGSQVQRGRVNDSGDSLTAGTKHEGRSRKARIHLLNHKHKAKREQNGSRQGFLNSKPKPSNLILQQGCST